MDVILASLDDLVGDQLQAVSYKWLARNFDVPYDAAKRILFQFMSKNGQVRAPGSLACTTPIALLLHRSSFKIFFPSRGPAEAASDLPGERLDQG